MAFWNNWGNFLSWSLKVKKMCPHAVLINIMHCKTDAGPIKIKFCAGHISFVPTGILLTLKGINFRQLRRQTIEDTPHQGHLPVAIKEDKRWLHRRPSYSFASPYLYLGHWSSKHVPPNLYHPACAAIIRMVMSPWIVPWLALLLRFPQGWTKSNGLQLNSGKLTFFFLQFPVMPLRQMLITE